MIKLLLLSCGFLLTSTVNSQSDRELKNLEVFAKAYGYVKYFHPSDEASTIDWGRFSVYGSSQVVACKTDEELQLKLHEIFRPIAPSVVFSNHAIASSKVQEKFRPLKPNKYKKTYWQHEGVAWDVMYQNDGNSPYSSYRIGRTIQKGGVGSSFGNILTSIDAQPYLGKKIRLSAWVKLNPASSGTGHLWVRVDNHDRSMGFFENMDAFPIRSSEWKKYNHEFELDSLSKSVVFGCFLKGLGELYFDDVSIEYEEDGAWKEIPLKNADFESEKIGESKEQWKGRGEGYKIEAASEVVHSGSFAGRISGERVETKKEKKAKQLFKASPELEEVFIRDLGGTIIHMPLMLYYSKAGTYPTVASSELAAFNKKLDGIELNPQLLLLRLGNCVNIYNVFQHFYPYFDVVDVNWDLEFKKSLKRCFSDTSQLDHVITLQKFTAPLNDGHISISGAPIGRYRLPIAYEWIEEQLVVAGVFDENLSIKKGQVITHLDQQPTGEYFQEIRSRISAGTEGWLIYRASSEGIYGDHGSSVTLTIEGKDIVVPRSAKTSDYRNFEINKRPIYKSYDNSIFYLNLDKIEMDTIHALMDQLVTSKAIICDMRGYPNGNHDFLSHLSDVGDTSTAWMQVSQMIYPDQEKIYGFSKHQWGGKPKQPYLGDKKIIFLIDGSAISYAESYMGYVEGYNLGTIIGQPTAGTNGNVNPVRLAGGIVVRWTGMKVLKHDGSQHHGIGILPDVYVTRTIEGVRDGRDEFLEKAFELIEKDL
jgi:C-terminal processing protease CtpA/Prc